MKVVSVFLRLSDTKYHIPLIGAKDYTSLAGVSFPAATTAGHKLSLLNGLQSSQPGFGTGAPAYTVIGGMVHLAGALHQTTGTNDEFAVLPAAARPARVLYLTVYTFEGSPGYCRSSPMARCLLIWEMPRASPRWPGCRSRSPPRRCTS
jgi:hypothetical protein